MGDGYKTKGKEYRNKYFGYFAKKKLDNRYGGKKTKKNRNKYVVCKREFER